MEDHKETPLTRTKIVATVGPSCASVEMLGRMANAGVDVFRWNFAHGTHEDMEAYVAMIRHITQEFDRPIGILGDLAGPKIRLGDLPGGSLQADTGGVFTFRRAASDPKDASVLSTTYDGLVDDLDVADQVFMADGLVAMRVVQKTADAAVCIVEHSGELRSGQGVNLPSVDILLPSMTQKDLDDLAWALKHELDFIGLSFVRDPEDISALRKAIADLSPSSAPFIVAKMEKREALSRLDQIIAATDIVMVARGDLGVEVDVERVPIVQKQIIDACNARGVPVITATQMLDSMQRSPMPTRAEASDVANAVLDGTDAVMLSGETAVGAFPLEAVGTMSRIIREAEPLVTPRQEVPSNSRAAATAMTRAVALGSLRTAEQLGAKIIAVATRTGKTAIAMSGVRSSVPIVAVTEESHTARRLALVWGVSAIVTDIYQATPEDLRDIAVTWGRQHRLLFSGDTVVLVATTDWTQLAKNVMFVQTVD